MQPQRSRTSDVNTVLLSIIVVIAAVVAIFWFVNLRDQKQSEREQYRTCLRSLTDDQIADYDTANRICH